MSGNGKTPQVVGSQGELNEILIEILELKSQIDYLFKILLICFTIRAAINTVELIISFLGN